MDGERFVETDVIELLEIADHPEGTRIGPCPVALTFTSHAVYMRPVTAFPDVLRVPYQRIVSLASRGPVLTFKTSTGGSYSFAERAPRMGTDKYDLISQQVASYEVHRESIELPDGSQILAICRPLDEAHSPEWCLSGDADLNDPTSRATIEAALGEAIEQFGPIRWKN